MKSDDNEEDVDTVVLKFMLILSRKKSEEEGVSIIQVAALPALPMSERSPQAPHTTRLRATLPVRSNRPFGLTKIPEPVCDKIAWFT